MNDNILRALGELIGQFIALVLAWLGWRYGLVPWLGLPELTLWKFFVLSFVIEVLVGTNTLLRKQDLADSVRRGS